MFEWITWLDHVTQYEDRYTESRNDDGTITHTPVEGEVLQQGTPQNADNFNRMVDGIINAGELAALLSIGVIHLRQQTEELTGEVQVVDLTNTNEYPFNNSQKTVALKQKRNHLDYTVAAEVMESSGGCVGDIEITEKLVNGFKIAHTGSATKVKVKVFIRGGMY